MTAPAIERTTADDMRTLYCPACSRDLPADRFLYGCQDMSVRCTACVRASGNRARFVRKARRRMRTDPDRYEALAQTGRAIEALRSETITACINYAQRLRPHEPAPFSRC